MLLFCVCVVYGFVFVVVCDVVECVCGVCVEFGEGVFVCVCVFLVFFFVFYCVCVV